MFKRCANTAVDCIDMIRILTFKVTFLYLGQYMLTSSSSSSSMALQLRYSLSLLDNILPLKTVLYMFCPLHKLHLLQIIPDIIFPSRFGPSSWSSSEWFPFVFSFHCAGFGHPINVFKPTQSLGFNIICYVPVFIWGPR